MLPEIEKLLILQDRDQKLRRLRGDLHKLPEDAARAKARFSSGETALQAAKSAMAENEVAIKKLQLDIDTRRTTIGRLKTQQFETRKNDEYKALEHEIDRYTEDVSKLEDAELELMEKGETLKKNVAAATEALAATRASVEEELGQMKTRHVNLTTQVKELEAERAELAAGLEATLVQRYDRIFDKKAPAIAPLENGICGGCHMKVTPATLTSVKAGKAIAYCENCSRILYWVP